MWVMFVGRRAWESRTQRCSSYVSRCGGTVMPQPVFPIGGTRLAHPAPLRDFISESCLNETVTMETMALVPLATRVSHKQKERYHS